MNSRKHRFQHGARSIIQMGEELIGHPSSALNELVKNGYDADATQVDVYVHIANTREESFLIIADNGTGMSDDILFGDWLKPSVSSKRTQTHSTVFERRFLGNKGIGRLAAMALGEKLTVITKTSTCEKFNWIYLESQQFYEETLLENIEFPGDEIINYLDLFRIEELRESEGIRTNNNLLEFLQSRWYNCFKEGTVIVIEQLEQGLFELMKDEFGKSENEISLSETSLMKSLSILITPMSLSSIIQNELIEAGLLNEVSTIANEKSTFAINYGSNLIADFDIESSELEEVTPVNIIEGFDYRLKGIADAEGNVSGELTVSRLKSDSYVIPFKMDKSEIWDIQDSEENVQENQVINEEIEINNVEVIENKEDDEDEKKDDRDLGAFLFDLRIYDREKETIEKLNGLLKSNTNKTKQLLSKLLGVRVAKNGFGVKPYGEESQDWLGLGQIRVQDPSRNIGPNQILGNLYLFSPENDGLKEKTNREGFYENRAFQQLKTITLRIIGELGQTRFNYRVKHQIGRKPGEGAGRPKSEEYLRYIQENASADVVNRTKEYIKEADQALDEAEERLTLSEKLASLGNSLELMYHEMAQPITILGGAELSIEDNIENILPLAVKNEIQKELENISEAIGTLDELKNSLEPAIGKSRKRNFYPIVTFKKVIRLYKKNISDYNIQIDIDNAIEGFQIKENEYAFWIAFLNILNNAVYWLSSEENDDRRILISLNNNDIEIGNTGPLIDKNIIDTIFEYGVSNKPGKHKSGLGLSYTKSLLNKNGWDITTENRSIGPVFSIKQIIDDGENNNI